MLELILLLLFVGMLLSVVSMLWQGTQVPRGSSAHMALFSAGAIYPYNLVVSLRAKHFLPWVPLPDFSGCGSFAVCALALSRIGAYIALFALVGLVVVWVANVQA